MARLYTFKVGNANFNYLKSGDVGVILDAGSESSTRDKALKS